MGSRKTICVSLLMLMLPIYYCYDDPVTLSLMERMETLEKKDKEKSITIERMAKQLSSQQEKIQIMELTIENIMEYVPKHTNSQSKRESGKTPKLYNNQSDVLTTKVNISKFALNSTRKMLLQSDSNNVVRNQSSFSEIHTEKKQRRKWTTEVKKDRSVQSARNDINGHHVIQGTAMNNKENISQNDIDTLNRHKDRFVRTIEGPVAFHAVSNKGKVSHLGPNENIKFETVLLNDGGGFHSQHGLFIAPKSGIYLFSTSVLAADTMVNAEITPNGAVLAKAYAFGKNGVAVTQGSVSVVTQMDVGDEVWIRHSYPVDGAFWGDGFTSFTGVLIANV